MWLRDERCGRAPDDEGMRLGRGSRGEDIEGGYPHPIPGEGGEWLVPATRVPIFAFLHHSLSDPLYREDIHIK